jgi:hypothetical protein
MPAKRSLSRIFTDVVKAVLVTAIVCIGAPLIMALIGLVANLF